jgi:hypothetical protein
MNRNQILIRPDTVETGAMYILRDFMGNSRKIAWEPVRFVSYAACPGIVLVNNGCGVTQPVQRADLFCTFCSQE